MKVLVTGGTGYIGGTVAGLLNSEGHKVVIFDNLYRSKREMLPAGADFIEGDLANRAHLENIFREAAEGGHAFDAVLHFAALIEAGESMQQPESYFRGNTAATLSLLEAMIATGPKRMVFSSTAAVYGEPESVPIVEDARLAPTNVYGESKLMIEHMLRWFNQIHSIRVASLRYFNVAGAHRFAQGEIRGEAHDPESHLIPIMLDVALGRRKSIRIYGDDYSTPDGTCIRDYIHVTDLARAHSLALQALDSRDWLTCNLGNGRGFSVKEVVESVQRVTGFKLPVEIAPRRPGDPAILVASSVRAKQVLGWEPKFTDLDSIIESAWEWHQKHYGV